MMTPELIAARLGTIQLAEKDDVVAGQTGSWTLSYTVGSYGLDSGAQLKICFPLVTDWEAPQFGDPAAGGFTSAETDGAARLRLSWQPKGYVRPWSRALVIDVFDGSLSPGDEVTVRLGDQRQGSPGMRAQTYLESRFEFLTLVDPTNGCDPRPLANSPTVRIVADALDGLVCLLPSQGVAGESVPIFVKGEDQWRNPVAAPAGLHFRWNGPGQATFADGAIQLDSPGFGHLEVRAGELGCRSNPIQILPQRSSMQRYWGDLHAQTKKTVGTGTEEEYFTFGREWGRLDFASHQGNDFQIDDEYWVQINAMTARFNDEGRFVVFPGYEWSGNSPAGGDHNVFYRREGLPIMRSSHWLIPHVPEDELTPAHPVNQLYDRLKQHVPAADRLVCAHVGGRYANLREYFDPDVVVLVELVSCWGVFEWMLWDALERDYIVGVMANSDGHHGRPGAEGAGRADFGIENGLTCVLADSLSRDAVFDALQARRCYSTTGARIWLDFQANGVPMGSVMTGMDEPVSLVGRVVGCGPLEKLELFRGRELVQEVRPAAFARIGASQHIRVSWQGSRERGRQRRVVWDGEIRLLGNQLESVALFSFDTLADGLVTQAADRAQFISRTTGDRDGLDLVLAEAAAGELVFASAVAEIRLPLAELDEANPRRIYHLGGVDMALTIERYPTTVVESTLELVWVDEPPAGQLTAYFLKATQVDGQMAWSSPIYIDNR